MSSRESILMLHVQCYKPEILFSFAWEVMTVKKMHFLFRESNKLWKGQQCSKFIFHSIDLAIVIILRVKTNIQN